MSRNGRWERTYDRIARAIRYIDERRLEQPDLDAVARHVHLSPYHFQRLFTDWAGVTPKRFLGFLTVAHARRALAESASVLDAALDAGLSGPSRLHDLFVAHEAATPGEVKARGAGLDIAWGFHATPFGRCLLLASPRGICGLSFLDEGESRDEALARARADWPAARFVADPERTGDLVARVFGGGADVPLRLHLSGTNFQIKVWEALLRVPPGRLISYGALARAAGCPGAARAVGNALAANPIAVLIPCHRVIRGTGAFEGYRWGPVRRKVLVGWEAARMLGEEPSQSPSTSRME